MTLREILRTHTNEPEESLLACEQNIRALGLERDAQLAQAESLGMDVDRERSDAKAKGDLLEATQAKARDLDRQIEQLRRERDDLMQNTPAISEGLMAAEGKLATLLEDRKKINARLERLGRQIKEAVSQKERCRERLRLARRTAFRSYVEDVEARLSRQVLAEEERSEKVASRRRLEGARHQDSAVMTLYEARTELRSLLRISNVAAVRRQLQEQLDRTENEIGVLFPGALDVDPTSEGVSQVEEIFFSDQGEGVSRIFLPGSTRTWNTIAEGTLDATGRLMLGLVWAMARTLDLRSDNAKLCTMGDLVVLEVDKDLEATVESSDVSIPVPISGAVTFRLSMLPRQILEDIAREDPDR